MKTKLVFLLLLCLGTSLFCETLENTTILQFDSTRVDNAYVISKVPNAPATAKYLVDLGGIDIAYDKSNPSDYWGVAAENHYDFIYYLNSAHANYIFGYNPVSGDHYLKKLGPVLTTYDGMIYAFDQFRRTVSYWNRNIQSFGPLGVVPREFHPVVAMAKDLSGDVYFLENDSSFKAISRYSPSAKAFIKFTDGSDRIDLNRFYNSDWANASGLAVNSNGIYVSYFGGVVVRYSLAGVPENYYWIDKGNLSLPSSSQSVTSSTWLKNIAVDRDGTVYVVDVKAARIHTFSKDLKYLASWHDPNSSRAISSNVVGIVFHPNADKCFLIYPWGFLAYQKAGVAVRQ